jgi:hypothetical protein
MAIYCLDSENTNLVGLPSTSPRIGGEAPCRWNKYALAAGKAGIAGLKLVDWLVWDTQTFGMGNRTRHRAEVLAFLQKEPSGLRPLPQRALCPRRQAQGSF